MPNEPIDTLEIKIKSDSTEGVKGIDNLIEKLNQLKNIASGNAKGVSSLTKTLDKIKTAAAGTDKASENLTKVADAISKLNGVKISAAIANQINRIGDALKNIDPANVSTLQDLTGTLTDLRDAAGSGNIKISIPKASAEKGKTVEPKLDTDGLKPFLGDISDISEKLEEVNGKTLAPKVELAQLESLRDTVEDVSSRFSLISRENILPDVSGIQTFRNSFEDVAESIGVFQTTGRIVDVEIEDIGRSADKSSFSLRNLASSLQLGMFASVPGIFKSIGKGISFAVPFVERFAKQMAKATLEVAKFSAKAASAPFRAIGSAFSSIGNKVTGLFNSIKRIAFYRLIRSMIRSITDGFKTGLENAYQYSKGVSGQLAKSLDSIATSSQYVKNSLGAMAAPLLNVLAPAIDFIADKLVALINLFNQVFAKFTGASTWMKAKKQAVEYQAAADGATKATKAFKATILGIDEINPLNDNSSNAGGGGGAGGADYASMFEEVPVDSSISDFVQDIKDAIDKGDWESVGSLISDKMILAMDQIDWNSVYKKSDKFGVNFASFLNGLFETKVDPKTGIEKNVFSSVGTTVASALNTALHAIDSFGSTFDFSSFGNGLASGLVAFLQTFDWATALKSAESWGTGIASALNSFLKKKDKDGNTAFSSIGETVGEAINTALSFLNSFGETFDFSGFGTSLGSGINKFLSTVKWESVLSGAKTWGQGVADALKGFLETTNWEGLGQAVNTAIVGAITLLDTFFKETDFKKAANAVVKFLKGLNWTSIAKSFGELLADAIGGLGSFTVETLKLLIKDMVFDDDGKINGEKVLKSLTKLINTVIGTVAGFTLSGGSVKGALVGFVLSSIVTAKMNDVTFDDNGKLSGKEISKTLVNTLVKLTGAGAGAAIGLAITGNPAGAKAGALIGFEVTSAIMFVAESIGWDNIKLDTEELLIKITNAIAEAWNGAIDWAVDNLPMLSFLEHLKLPTIDDGKAAGTATATGLHSGYTTTMKTKEQELLDPITKALGTEGAKKSLNNTGSTVATEINNGMKGHTYSGITGKIKDDTLTAENKTTLSGVGDSAGKSINSGLKGHGYSGLPAVIKADTLSKTNIEILKGAGDSAGKKINSGLVNHNYTGAAKSVKKGLTSEDAQKNYASAGASAAKAFVKNFNPDLSKKKLSVGVEGKLKIVAAEMGKGVVVKGNAVVDLKGHTPGSGGNYTVNAAGAYNIPTGQMFIAREAGPELVGTIGGHTSVANNDQIVKGISSGVYAANQEQNALLRQQNALLQQQNELLAQQQGGGNVGVSSIVTGAERYNRRVGRTVVSVGA